MAFVRSLASPWVGIALIASLLTTLAPTLGAMTSTAASLDTVAIPFQRNLGQHDAEVVFDAQLPAGRMFVTRGGELVYSLPRAYADGEPAGWTLVEHFRGGAPAVGGGAASAARISRFVGSDPAAWQPDIPTFASVTLGRVWQGVEVELRARGNNVEKIYTLAPGANPDVISMYVNGASGLRVDTTGALVASTGLGEVSFSPPIAFQERDGVRESVPVAYRVRGLNYGFEIGTYDRELPLVIDPVLQATYAGGGGVDTVRAVAVAASGDIYAVGTTSSTNFPGTTGGAQATNQGGVQDSFVARYNSTLTALLQATYYGGSANDVATTIALNATDVYIGGATTSTNLPNAAGGAVATLLAPCSPFLARLPLALTSVTQSTYLAGAGLATCSGSFLDGKRVNGIALTGGEVYAAGDYNESGFPPGAGAPAVPLTGAGFVTRLNLALTAVNQSSGIGQTGGFFGATSLAITGSDVYVGGYTNLAITGTTGGANPTLGAGRDGFVMRFNPALTAVSQSTYIGGNSTDTIDAMIVSGSEVFVHGNTASTDLPNVAGGAQTAPDSTFVARFNAALTTNPQTTYLGGSGGEGARAILATGGSIYVTGTTSSTNFPGTTGGIEPVRCTPSACTYVSRLTAALTAITQSTYYGGPTSTEPFALAASGSEVVLGGLVVGNGLTGATGGAQSTSAGAATADGFLARLSLDLLGGPALPTITIGDVSVNEGNVGTTNFSFPVTLSAVSAQTVTVQFSTANGTAVAPGDYTTASGQVTFTPGTVTQNVVIAVQGDVAVEADETFFVNLTTPVNATILDGQGLGTIVNDDIASLPTISINNVSQAEGNAGTTNFVFTVSISSAANASANFATANGTATAGSDYVANSGTITFTSGGPLTQTITVAVNGDTAFESNETFFVNLSSPTGATLADAQGQGTIQNDDAAPPVAPVIANSPPNGAIDSPYSFQYLATGSPTITFALTTGAFPPGLTLSPSGNLAGTPTLSGTFTGAVTATNAVGSSPPRAFSITIGTDLPASPIPTLPEWALIALTLLLTRIGARFAHRPR